MGDVEDLLSHIVEQGDQARAVGAVYALRELAPEEFRSGPYRPLRTALEFTARGSYHGRRMEGYKTELASLEKSIQDMAFRSIMDRKNAESDAYIVERTTAVPLGDQGGRVRMANSRKAGGIQPLD